MRAQATAVACSLPVTQEVPLARWSRTELARWVAASPQLPHISASTIGRWLKAERIRPWRYHAWQHIQNPQTFLERAVPVLRLYEQASALLREGTWLVCVDEKTSIQAFQAFLQEAIIPEAQRRKVQKVVLILDNGPTHAPKQLARWLEDQATVLKDELTLQVMWLPVNASWLDQIEIWFSILQRKLFQPNHFLSTAALEQAISDFIAYYNQNAKPIKWSYTVEKLERKLGMSA